MSNSGLGSAFNEQARRLNRKGGKPYALVAAPDAFNQLPIA